MEIRTENQWNKEENETIAVGFLWGFFENVNKIDSFPTRLSRKKRRENTEHLYQEWERQYHHIYEKDNKELMWKTLW